MNKFNSITILGMLVSMLFFSSAIGQSIDPKFKKMIEQIYTDFPTINPKAAQKLIGKEKVYFLDTREFKEYQVSHIPGALWIGFNHLEWNTINRLELDATIIVYCSVGARSQNIGNKLQIKGFKNVKNLYGGLFLWANQDRPMKDQNEKSTTDVHGFNVDWGKWIKKGKVVY